MATKRKAKKKPEAKENDASRVSAAARADTVDPASRPRHAGDGSATGAPVREAPGATVEEA